MCCRFRVFILHRDDEKVILVKHVDDCLLAATKGSSLLDFVSKSLSKVYTLTTSIEPTNFVGLAIISPNKSLTITQSNYAATLIDRFSITTSSAKYPTSEDYLTGLNLHADDIILTAPFRLYFRKRWDPFYSWLLRLARISCTLRLSFLDAAIRLLQETWLQLINYFGILRRLLR